MLLCERCGYDIGGLEADGACPECGLAIVESLPSRRVGSAWQRRGPGVRDAARAWARTFVDVVRRPGSVIPVLRIERRGQRLLIWTNVLLAAAMMAGCWGKQLVAARVRFGSTENFRGEVALAAATVMLLMLMPIIATTLVGLIWIEQRGVRFFGSRRGWRVTRDVAWTVCAYASYWWVVGAATALAVMMALPTDWIDGLRGKARSVMWNVAEWAWISPAVLLVFALGLLPFETLVYFGVRRCRFANVEARRETGGERREVRAGGGK